MAVVVFLALGALIGAFGTLVGIGGGLILVPVCIMFMSEGSAYPYFSSAPEIVGTSMFFVFTNAVSGTLAYIRQKRVLYRVAVPFSVATLPGAFFGSYVADRFDAAALDFWFGLFLLCIGSVMFFNSRKRKDEDERRSAPASKTSLVIGTLASTGIGFLASLFGVGGGVLHVPIMVYALGFPTHIATATSHFVLAVSSAMGLASHMMLGHIVWLPAVALGVGAAVGAQVGARISARTRPRIILTLLSFAMLGLALRLIFMGTAK